MQIAINTHFEHFIVDDQTVSHILNANRFEIAYLKRILWNANLFQCKMQIA